MEFPSPPLRALSSLLLQPWLDTLHAMKVHPVASDASTGDGVWLRWTLPPDAPLARCIEAAELLVLLAWADRGAWLAVVSQLQTMQYRFMIHDWTALVLAPALPVRVHGYDVVFRLPSQGAARTFCEHWSDTKPYDQLSDYYYVRGILESKIDQMQVEIPMRLRLTYTDATLSAITSLAKLQKKLKTQIAGSDTSTPLVCRLADFRSRVHSAHDDKCAGASKNEKLLYQLAAIWKYGVRIIDLPRIQLTSKQAGSNAFVAAYRELLGVGCEGCVQRVVVARQSDTTQVVPLLSALAHSSSVRAVVFDFEETREGHALDARRAVQWMAYALFSAQTTNVITKVSLSTQYLTIDHVDAMRELLDADDPLEVLFPDLAESIRAHSDTRISTSGLLFEDPTNDTLEDAHEPSLMADIDFTDLRVLGCTGRWWSVFLPGWGPAWVETTHAVASQFVVTAVKAKIHSVSELVLTQLRAENDESVVALLRLVSIGVRILELVETSRSIEGLCPDFFDACSTLEELKLREVVPSRLAVFVESFAAGRCRSLARLDLLIELLTEAAVQEIEQMFEALADPEHPMAQQLESLKVHFEDDDDIVDSSVFEIVLRMLQANKKLAQLKLELPLCARDMNAVKRLFNELAKHHDELLPTPVAPLGAREKAAFLSAAQLDTGESRSAMQQFDQHIVSSIFAFAPDRRRRTIDIRMPDTYF